MLVAGVARRSRLNYCRRHRSSSSNNSSESIGSCFNESSPQDAFS
jgi:hypothetical protein